MIIHDCIQGTDEWFAVRMGKVTASCFADATSTGRGSSPSKTRKTYMMKLIAERMTGLPQDSYSNDAMQAGTDMEPYAREYYELINDVPVKQVGFVERDENIGCSPDGLVGEDGMLEIKCPFSSTHIRYLLDGGLPATYRKQVQGQLWVCEREWCDFVSYDPRVARRPYFCERVYRDDDFIKELHIKIIMFVNELKDMMEQLTASPF